MTVAPVEAPPILSRIQRPAIILGAVGLVAGVIGYALNPAQFFHSYLFAYMFWFGITVCALPILMIDHLAGGRWGAVIQRFLEASTRLLPLMALLFIPIVLGIGSIYEWSHADVVANDALLQHKAPYLNIPFFVLRAVLYFVIFIGMSVFLNRWSRERDLTGDYNFTRRLRRLGGYGLPIFTITLSFVLIDWLMSLEPHWFSTMYPLMVGMGMMVTAFAFVILMLILFSRYQPVSDVASPKIFSDLGSLLFSFIMIWAYFSYSQFMLMWYANLPEEAPWYLTRMSGGWQWIAIAIILFMFVLPFFMLISGDIKRSGRWMIFITLVVLGIRLVDMFWLVMPAFQHGHAALTVSWLDIVMPIALGGIWVGAYLWQLGRRPLVALHEPDMPQPALEAEHGH